MTDELYHSDNKQKSWFERLSDWLMHEPQDREQLIDVLREAGERNLLSAEHLSMIESILQVSEMQARDIMTPKANMITIMVNNTLADLLPIVVDSEHSRFPVVDHSNNIIGVLLVKDILKAICSPTQQEQFTVSKIIRPAIFIPQSKRLDILLQEFRKNRSHMAIVLNEHGYVAGLVTIEDVLEQIVGDIADEYDIGDDENIKNHDDINYTVKASMPIADFNEYFSCNLATTEFDTISGILLQAFGYLPQPGEVIRLKHLDIKILHSDHRRIYLIAVKVTPQLNSNSD
jgi:magnesium and cobalt transporter